MPRLADKGQQEIELGRRQVDPPAGGTYQVARGLLERPPGEQIEPLDRQDVVGAPGLDVALLDSVFSRRPILAGVVHNEYSHPPPRFR